MATTTTNYALEKPETTDIISVTPFNENFDKIDETMKANEKAASTPDISSMIWSRNVTKNEVFAAQTIDKDLTAYRFILIACLRDTGTDATRYSSIFLTLVPVYDSNNASGSYDGGSGGYPIFTVKTTDKRFLYEVTMMAAHGTVCTRNVKADKKSITFGDGYSGSTKDNKKVVPVIIWGIK